MEDYKLLLIDDEPDILEFLSYNLRKEGYSVFTAPDGDTGIRLALEELPHLVLLDVMMPGKDGVETCGEMRSHRELETAVIAFLTARAEDYSQIAGFDAGADDYIAKPIRPKLLQARIAALLKRNRPAAAKFINSGNNNEIERMDDIIILPESYAVAKDGVHITLPRKEFELLSLLMSRPGKVFDREEIYGTVWGYDTVVGDRTIDVHIRRLREKIGDNRIQTLKGIGYKYIGHPEV